MEVVYSKLKGIDNTDSLYVQNNTNINKCNFENREQDYQNKNNDLLYNNNNAKVKEFDNSLKYSLIDDTEDMSISENDLLVNTNNIIHNNTSLINASNKYNEENNINKKYFMSQDRDNDFSTTQENTYSNPLFWTKNYYNIKDNGNHYRNIADTHIKLQDRKIESYSQDFRLEENNDDYLGLDSNNIKYSNMTTNLNNIEPKVSANYIPNYTENNEKIVHPGLSNNKKQKYKNSDNVYTGENVKNYGQIKYYNEGWLDKFNDEFKLNQNNYKLIDPNNNNYDRFECSANNFIEENNKNCESGNAYNITENFKYSTVEKGDDIVEENEKQQNFKKLKKCTGYIKSKENINNCPVNIDVPYEKNIMINRNEIMLASLNYKENQYRRKGFYH